MAFEKGAIEEGRIFCKNDRSHSSQTVYNLSGSQHPIRSPFLPGDLFRIHPALGRRITILPRAKPTHSALLR